MFYYSFDDFQDNPSFYTSFHSTHISYLSYVNGKALVDILWSYILDSLALVFASGDAEAPPEAGLEAPASGLPRFFGSTGSAASFRGRPTFRFSTGPWTSST